MGDPWDRKPGDRGWRPASASSSSRRAGQQDTSPSRAELYGGADLQAPPPRPIETKKPYLSRTFVFEWLFKSFPIGFPVALLVLGTAIWLIYLVLRLASAYVLATGTIGFVAGLVLLPFGIRIGIRRRIPVVLRCPHCGAESRSSARPFSIQRWGDVPYAYLVCSVCGRDFTIDKYINAR